MSNISKKLLTATGSGRPWYFDKVTFVRTYTIPKPYAGDWRTFNFRMKPDGTTLFLSGEVLGNRYFYTYDLSTPWDFSTLSLLGTSAERVASNYGLGYGGFYINGSNIIYSGNPGQYITQYTLNTAWSTLDGGTDFVNTNYLEKLTAVGTVFHGTWVNEVTATSDPMAGAAYRSPGSIVYSLVYDSINTGGVYFYTYDNLTNYSLPSGRNIITGTSVNLSSYFTNLSSGFREIFYDQSGYHAYVVQNEYITHFTCREYPYLPWGGTYGGGSASQVFLEDTFDVAGTGAAMASLIFKSDGTKFWILNSRQTIDQTDFVISEYNTI